MCRSRVVVALVPLVIAAFGCRSEPVPTDIRSLLSLRESFEGERVEVTAPVAENTFVANGHAVWRLTLGRPPETILAYEEGSNGAVLRNGSALADAAGRRAENVTVTGIFRTGASGSHLSGARIELETFRFGDESIDTDYGDISPASGYWGWGWGGWGPGYYGRAGWINGCD
jgi:hypothetical protein